MGVVCWDVDICGAGAYSGKASGGAARCGTVCSGIPCALARGTATHVLSSVCSDATPLLSFSIACAATTGAPTHAPKGGAEKEVSDCGGRGKDGPVLATATKASKALRDALALVAAVAPRFVLPVCLCLVGEACTRATLLSGAASGGQETRSATWISRSSQQLMAAGVRKVATTLLCRRSSSTVFSSASSLDTMRTRVRSPCHCLARL